MDDSQQVAAYAQAGRIDGVMASAYLFHSARISQTIQGCQEVVDLGCGPATQLAQVAQLNPAIRFHGVDLSETMLEDARRHVGALGLKNTRFSQGDITQLDFLPSHSADGVISTMAFHHLPTREHLRACFREIRRVLRPGGALYLVDFGRLKSLKSVIYFAYLNAAHQPHLFSLDYERSLRAAFLFEDFVVLAREELPDNAAVVSTFLMPMLTLIKTPDCSMAPELTHKLKAMRDALPTRYRRDLDEIRTFFRLGRLDNDPFS
jgi:SAM-dependent methyltransferase